MKALDAEVLAGVSGGMNLDGVPQSTNVEDRRGMSRRESMSVRPKPVALPPLQRTPGDLSSQAGLDDMDKLFPRRRRR